MKVSIDKIYEFHKKRTACHVASVNYFAGLLGYQFPEHDNDKNAEPMRTGYAYKNYATYHPEYNLPDNYAELFGVAHKTHHEHASHHIESYSGDVSRIPDVCLIEMICDWFSANFEQVFIQHDLTYATVKSWLDMKIAHLNWSDAQLQIIHETSELLERTRDNDVLVRIWEEICQL